MQINTYININKTKTYNIEIEDRILVILYNPNLNSPFEFYLDYNLPLINQIENKYIRYHLLHAYNENLKVSIAYVKDLYLSLISFINYLIEEFSESEYLFKYVPVLFDNITYEQEILLLEQIKKIYDNNLGAILYGNNDSINHQLYVYIPKTISVIDESNFYYNLHLVIQLAKKRMEDGFSSPHNNELLSYLYNTINTFNLSGFYELQMFSTVLDYEYILSTVISLRFLLYRSLILYKHKFFNYITDIELIITNILDKYINPIAEKYDYNFEIDENNNLLIIVIQILFKKPNLLINININLP